MERRCVVRQVHVRDRDSNGVLNRLIDPGHEEDRMPFESGHGWVSKYECIIYGWTVCDGWPDWKRG
jgi:hypothetical protein